MRADSSGASEINPEKNPEQMYDSLNVCHAAPNPPSGPLSHPAGYLEGEGASCQPIAAIDGTARVPLVSRRHYRKTPAEIAIEAAAIAAGAPVPESRTPKITSRHEARMEALSRACPTCGAPSGVSCRAKRPDHLR